MAMQTQYIGCRAVIIDYFYYLTYLSYPSNLAHVMKKVFPLDLNEDLHRRLKHAAIDAGLTLQAFIIHVLEGHIDHDSARTSKGTKNNDQPAHRGR